MQLTRRRRTYVVALAAGAIVVAANASEGAYFSQSWGWVALSFLVPTSLALVLERARMPGRLRIAFAACTTLRTSAAFAVPEMTAIGTPGKAWASSRKPAGDMPGMWKSTRKSP